MQILANKGYEFGERAGLGWIDGTVEKLKAKILPNIGWNDIKLNKRYSLFSNLDKLNDFYFVHSYVLKPENKNYVTSETYYVTNFCSSVEKNHIFGVQFHPEKSQKAGQQLIKNFLDF
jgi:glutamine amidotransferase